MTIEKKITVNPCNSDNLDLFDEVLRGLFEEMPEKWDAALESGSVEGVHELRVATRRLRSALRNLSFLLKKKPLEKLKVDLKQIADALGAVRDQDVAIIGLEKLKDKSSVKIIKAGIAELIEQRRKSREKAQAVLVKMLSATALEDLQRLFDKALLEAGKRKNSARVVSFKQTGCEVVSKSLDEFCDLTDHIYKPFNDNALHRLRIAAKRLRYGIGLYQACWGALMDPFAEAIAEMQDFLGKVHDANVWLQSLARNLHNSKEVSPAQIWLLSEFVEKRTKNYRAALGIWSDWKDTGFIEKLRSTISQTP